MKLDTRSEMWLNVPDPAGRILRTAVTEEVIVEYRVVPKEGIHHHFQLHRRILLHPVIFLQLSENHRRLSAVAPRLTTTNRSRETVVSHQPG